MAPLLYCGLLSTLYFPIQHSSSICATSRVGRNGGIGTTLLTVNGGVVRIGPGTTSLEIARKAASGAGVALATVDFRPAGSVGINVGTLAAGFSLTQPDGQTGAFETHVIPGGNGEILQVKFVPEPLTLAALLAGAVGLSGYLRRRRKA